MVRLNSSQRSIIFTYEVFGSAFDTLMNLERNIAVNMGTLFCYTYIVVNTSITVRLTVIMASKKKGLK